MNDLKIRIVFGGQGPFVWLFSIELGLLFIRCGEVAKNWIWIMMSYAKSTPLQTNHEVECCGTLSLKQNYLLWPCVVVNLQKPWRWDVCTTYLWRCHQNHQNLWITKCKVLREKKFISVSESNGCFIFRWCLFFVVVCLEGDGDGGEAFSAYNLFLWLWVLQIDHYANQFCTVIGVCPFTSCCVRPSVSVTEWWT